MNIFFFAGEEKEKATHIQLMICNSERYSLSCFYEFTLQIKPKMDILAVKISSMGMIISSIVYLIHMK